MYLENKLKWINVSNGTAGYQIKLLEKLMAEFSNDKLVALEVGSAAGGAVEFTAKLWGERGAVYGYDTFEGYPKDLADDQESSEAHAMDIWKEIPGFGKEEISYEYQGVF